MSLLPTFLSFNQTQLPLRHPLLLEPFSRLLGLTVFHLHMRIGSCKNEIAFSCMSIPTRFHDTRILACPSLAEHQDNHLFLFLGMTVLSFVVTLTQFLSSLTGCFSRLISLFPS